jgi:transcription elongation factor GreA
MSEEHTVYLTPDGLEKLEEELKYLRTVRRQEIAKRLRAALEEEDILENAEYDDAKNEQAFVEGRILTLETMLRNAAIIEEGESSDEVRVGSRITIMEQGANVGETYRLVGSAEADPTQGRISNESPLGRALLGHRVGDEVLINAPDGMLSFHIVAIE